jgi:undecaprenyl-diphosphatase
MADKPPGRSRKPKGAKMTTETKDSTKKKDSPPAAEPPSTTKKPKVPEAEQPKQKLGDTPVAPWQMPTPSEKAAAEPVKKALDEALEKVTTPEAADKVVENLEAAFTDQKAVDVAPAPKTEPAKEEAKSVEKVAASVKEASDSAPASLKPERVIAEAAIQTEQATGPAKEAAAQAVQEVLNPQQQGVPEKDGGRLSWRRRLLQQAQLRRLKPLDAVDARLYIAINHLPHNRFLNGFFYFFTFVFNGGWAWYVLLTFLMAARRRASVLQFRNLAGPLTTATLMVEFPIKFFFKRRRPFIDVVRAIVIGKKPGTWSFPSGHSAAAFAGAYVMRQLFPGLTALFYGLAATVAFSRIYLGDHYPGDVVSGSALGHLFAMIVGKMLHIKPARRRRRWLHR